MTSAAVRLDEWLALPAETEWLEFKEAKNGFATDELGQYVSALANEANLLGRSEAWLVFGVKNRRNEATGMRPVVGSRFMPTTVQLNEVKQQLAANTSPAISLCDPHEVEHPDCPTGTRVLCWPITPAPRGVPVSWKGHYYGRHGESLGALALHKLEAIRAQAAVTDWSAATVAEATLEDLDATALRVAREKYAAKHQRERWAAEIPGWSTTHFLDQAKLAVHGQLTRAALLLLGTPQSAHRLSPQPAQIAWKLPAERALESFGAPFLLNTTEVLKRIRVPMLKLFPAAQLLAVELPKYETRIVLEALHNAIAHQDYERCERVVVEEHLERLLFISAGGFVDGDPSDYVTGMRTPGRYRNKWLADAMNELGMIDTGGYGIRDMFAGQRKRFLPLPDYERSDASHVRLEIFGQTIDENYSRVLMERSDLPIEQVVWLDRVQKRQRIDDVQAAVLRRAKLIEGRKPNWFVSAQVADLTDRRAEYTRTKGLDDLHFKKLVVAHLRKFGSATGEELDRLILDKLPEVLTPLQKRHKVKNLRTSLRTKGLDGSRLVADRRGLGARWRLKTDPE